MQRAGAHVLDIEEPSSNKTHITCSELIVVTDDRERARIVLRDKINHTGRKIYVARGWATKVLTEQEWRSETQYILEQTNTEKVAESNSTSFPESEETAIDTTLNEGETSQVLPVWCHKRLDESSELKEKVMFLRSLPKFLCERCTMTQALYKAPNHELCKALEIIAKKRRLEQAGGSVESADIRGRAYQRASAALKCLPFKLRTAQDAKALYSLGPRVLAIVNEFLTTGVVKEAQLMETNERLKALTKFQRVYGVGYVKARKFYDELGIRSMKDLLASEQKSDKGEDRAVVRYLRHIECIQSLSSKEASAFKDVVHKIANSGDENDLHLRFQLCGGFRRGEKSGHDVDILYCRREMKSQDCNSVLRELVKRLQNKGIVIEILKESSDVDGWNEVHYHSQASSAMFPYAHDVLHALAKYKGKVFRLDLVGVRDAREFCFATIAWSGSTPFQRDLRWWCDQKKGWTFNEHGVFDRNSGKRVELNPEPRSEMDVFAALGLTYRAPYERSC
ncbi:unnamed protein product [Agarophyton chilense]